jgi:hypothetical protein
MKCKCNGEGRLVEVGETETEHVFCNCKKGRELRKAKLKEPPPLNLRRRRHDRSPRQP